MASGYTTCSCRDCFDLTISTDVMEPELCSACDEADCYYAGEDCQREDAYSE